MKRVCTGWIAVILWLNAALAYGFADVETDTVSLNARLAIDGGGGVQINPGPKQLYPDEVTGDAFIGLRLLVNALFVDRLNLDVNLYQGARYTNGQSLFSANDSSYRTTYLDSDWFSDDDFNFPFFVDSLSLKIYGGPVDVTIGRQPIGLATNYIFTPNDFFHPFASTAADREFRPGVDAIRIDAMPSYLSQITAIVAMGYDENDQPAWERCAAILRGQMNIDSFDFSVLGGQLDRRYVFGGAFTGEVLGLGVRGEGNITFPKDDIDQWYGRFAVGFDKRWENTVQLALEYYYRGQGAEGPDDYLTQAATMTDFADPYLGRHFLGLSISGEATPLLVLQAVALMNVTDPSFYVTGAATYSLDDNIDMIATLGIPLGRKPGVQRPWRILPRLRSEFGSYPYSASLLFRFYI